MDVREKEKEITAIQLQQVFVFLAALFVLIFLYFEQWDFFHILIKYICQAIVWDYCLIPSNDTIGIKYRIDLL